MGRAKARPLCQTLELILTNTNIQQQLSDILLALSVPPTIEEEQDEWTKESKEAAHKYFSALSTAFFTDTPLPDLGIVRGLNHWGVNGGNLLESIARVTNSLRATHEKN